MAELVRQNVRLEQSRVSEDRHVARQQVTGADSERKGEPDQGEVANGGARSHMLAGDAGDRPRERPVDLYGQLTAGDPLQDDLVVQTADERLHLGLADLAWHRLHVPDVGPEFAAEVDPADVLPVAPVPKPAAEIHAE